MTMVKPKWAWLDGDFVAWDDAKIHIHSNCVLRGTNVFEGVRAYWNEEHSDLYAFRMPDHMTRLAQSMKILRIALPYSLQVLADASMELLRRCEYREDVHFRPTVYVGESEDNFGIDPLSTTIGAFIVALPRPRRKAVETGIHVSVSSWQRISDLTIPPRAKVGANYINSRMAIVQAKVDGYDSTVILNERGKVSELPTSCLMMVRHNRLVTPPLTDNILESITRETIMLLARDELGLAVEERSVDRTELYVADELFACGTAEEVTPIVSVDRYQIGEGKRGQITKAIQELYGAMVRGEIAKFKQYLNPTYRAPDITELSASSRVG